MNILIFGIFALNFHPISMPDHNLFVAKKFSQVDTIVFPIKDDMSAMQEEIPAIRQGESAVIEVPGAEAIRVVTHERAVQIDGASGADFSYYLCSSENPRFYRETVFPLHSGATEGSPVHYPVFIEERPAGTSHTSEAYRSYLERGMHEQDQVYQFTAWMPVMVILSLLLLTWIKVIYVQFLTPVLLSAFNYKEAAKLYQVKSAPAQNAFMILHLIFAINAGLFFLFVVDYFDLKMPFENPVILFLAGSGFIILFMAAKFILMSLVGFIFDKSKIFAEYIHNVSLYNKIYGILLLPVIVGLLYLEYQIHRELIYGGLILGVLFYLLKFVRGLEIIIKKEFSVFYLILYLCAFEIIPLFVLYKLFQVSLI